MLECNIIRFFIFSKTSKAGERLGGAPSGDRKPDEKAVAMVRNTGGLQSRNLGGRVSMNCFQGHIGRTLGFIA